MNYQHYYTSDNTCIFLQKPNSELIYQDRSTEIFNIRWLTNNVCEYCGSTIKNSKCTQCGSSRPGKELLTNRVEVSIRFMFPSSKHLLDLQETDTLYIHLVKCGCMSNPANREGYIKLANPKAIECNFKDVVSVTRDKTLKIKLKIECDIEIHIEQT